MIKKMAENSRALDEDGSVARHPGSIKVTERKKATDEDRSAVRSSSDEVILAYIKGISKRPLNDWLKRVIPSQITDQDGADWIAVYCPHTHSDKKTRDVAGLMKSWTHLTASDSSINYQSIKELATKHNVTAGKWCLFASTGGKIDEFWSRIARHVVDDPSFPCNSAKVSTVVLDGVWSGSHVVCMYTNNFCDKDEILRLEEAIRRIGIKSKLFYKPDVYTYLGIYSPKVMTNPWGLKPMIMESNFDIIQGRSVIKDFVN